MRQCLVLIAGSTLIAVDADPDPDADLCSTTARRTEGPHAVIVRAANHDMF